MQFKGVLNVFQAAEKNRSGQVPLTIEFVGEGDVSLQVIGVRLSGKVILDSVAVVKGISYKHTSLSPALQAAIIASGKAETEITQEESNDYQQRMSDEMEQRRKRAMDQ